MLRGGLSLGGLVRQLAGSQGPSTGALNHRGHVLCLALFRHRPWAGPGGTKLADPGPPSVFRLSLGPPEGAAQGSWMEGAS